MIKILSALICCGIANYLIFHSFSGSEMYFCMLLVALICLILIIVHRHQTKSWCSEHKDYDEDHNMIFVPSAFVSLVVIFIGIVGRLPLDFFVGILTFGIPCVIIGIREIDYVW